MAKVKTSISIDEELFKEITDMSKDEDRSFSKQISHLIRKATERVDSKDQE